MSADRQPEELPRVALLPASHSTQCGLYQWALCGRWWQEAFKLWVGGLWEPVPWWAASNQRREQQQAQVAHRLLNLGDFHLGNRVRIAVNSAAIHRENPVWGLGFKNETEAATALRAVCHLLLRC